VLQVLSKEQALREAEGKAQQREVEQEHKLLQQQDAQRATMSALQQQILSCAPPTLAQACMHSTCFLCISRGPFWHIHALRQVRGGAACAAELSAKAIEA
jgi:hypothetical protein